MWITRTVTLGEVSVNTKIPFVFKYTGLKNIQELSASCGCTDVAIVDRKIVHGTLSTGSFPTKALLERRLRQPMEKTIDVMFSDGSHDKLVISAFLLNPQVYS